MKKINKINRSLKILDKIEKIRARNNRNWMDILKLSIRLDYDKTARLIKQIYKHDIEISSLAKKIYKK